MELTVNTFLKGLLTDIHPMVQGNDVLSDALNATFVTMNGNEIILQNDMGNRRIDNAFLPPGYEPVGIKEYGGIIYIAAYNPLTNTSQVGSFPSPERKLSSEDEHNLEGILDVTKFKEENKNVLKTSSLLIPLTKEDSLHVGDKFVVYSDGLSNSKDLITNYNNIKENKIDSPKNRCYTLALGILNSQNEFVDITKSLVRWNTGNKIIKDELEGKSDLYKFNTGYFIADDFDNPQLDYTINDANLIRNRQCLAVNTYAYKLVGPLYLKATLNHILDFNYNIYGTVTRNNENKISACEIRIEGYITYNCPDGITDSSDDHDENYYSYYTGEIGKWPYTFITSENTPPEEYSTEDTSGNILGDHQTSYNPETNLYSVKLVKKYNISSVSGNMLGYALGVIANSELKYIVPHLSVKGTLDLDKLGTGLLKLNGWRFYNYDDRTKLAYNFEAYPKYGERFTNLTMTFTEVNPLNNNSHTFILKDLSIYNGRNTIEIDWEKEGVKPRTLYKVEITYSIESIFNDNSSENSSSSSEDSSNSSVNPSREVTRDLELNPVDTTDPFWKYPKQITDESGEVIVISNSDSNVEIEVPSSGTKTINIGLEEDTTTKIITFYRWFLSTPLLNDCYNPTSSLFVKDYCIPDSDDEKSIIKAKLAVQPEINLDITDNSETVRGIEQGEWFKSTNTDIEVTKTSTYKLNLKITPTVNIKKSELYPEWASVSINGNVSHSIKDYGYEVGNISEFYNNLISTKGGKEDSINCNVSEWKVSGANINNGVITKDIQFKDVFIASSSNEGSVTNPFVKAFDNTKHYFMKSVENQLEKLYEYIVLGTAYTHHAGSSDEKFLVYYLGEHGGLQEILFEFSDDRYRLETITTDGTIIFPEMDRGLNPQENYIKHKSRLRAFLQEIPSTAVISIAFDNLEANNRKIYPSNSITDSNIDSDTSKSRNNYSRIFWRRKDGYWMVLDTLLQRNNNLTNYIDIRNSLECIIKSEIFQDKDIIYCIADTIDFSDLGLYHPSTSVSEYKYNEMYSIDLKYYIETEAPVTQSGIVKVEAKGIGTYPVDYALFSLVNNNGKTITTRKITLVSDEDFLNKIQDMLEGNYSNMYLGITLDSRGYSLNKNKLYELEGGKLIESTLKNYYVSTNREFGNPNYNTILFTDTKLGLVLSKLFDFCYGDSDGDYGISYTDFDLYKPVMT